VPGAKIWHCILFPFRAIAALLNAIEAVIFIVAIAILLAAFLILPFYYAISYFSGPVRWWSYLIAALCITFLVRLFANLSRRRTNWLDTLVFGLSMFVFVALFLFGPPPW